jgi:hypothetical protein
MVMNGPMPIIPAYLRLWTAAVHAAHQFAGAGNFRQERIWGSSASLRSSQQTKSTATSGHYSNVGRYGQEKSRATTKRFGTSASTIDTIGIPEEMGPSIGRSWTNLEPCANLQHQDARRDMAQISRRNALLASLALPKFVKPPTGTLRLARTPITETIRGGGWI